MSATPSASVPLELGTESISALLKKYALPAIIAMTASSVYNIVDSIFIGQGVGPLAISGLAVTFPLMNLSTAFGTLVGIGGATMLSIFLGQKNYKAANKVLGNTFTLNAIMGLAFMLVCLYWLDPILRFFGASDATLPYAAEYMTIILYGNIITHLYFGLNGMMRSSGHPRSAMYLTLLTVVINSVLDPIFIFVLDWGIKGAAWATVISQAVAFVIVMWEFSDPRRILHFTLSSLRLDWRVAKSSLSIGFGPFLMHSAACVVTMVINQQLGHYYGDLGIGSYGINNRITFFFVMICVGLNQGMQPIAGYNYGAKLYSRVKSVYNKTVFLATVVVSIACLLSVGCPKFLVSLFTSDADLIAMASHDLVIMNCMIFIVGFHMITANFFQCLGMVKKSIFLSLIRQILYLIPLLYILPQFFGGMGVWLSLPVSDCLSFLTAMLMRASLLKKINTMKDGDDPALLGSNI